MNQNLYSLCSQPGGNSWRLGSISHTGTSIFFVHKQPRVWELPGPNVSRWTRDQRHDREQHFCFLPGFTSVDREGWSTSHFHLWQTWRFQFPHHKCSVLPTSPAYGVFISQLIRYARACSSYGCFILRTTRLSNKLVEHGYVKESSLRKFYGRYGDLIKQYEVSLSQMLNDILWPDHIQWQPPQIRLYTELDLLPNFEWFS